MSNQEDQFHKREQYSEDVSLLSERISAHTKAYVEMSNALVEIIKLIAANKECTLEMKSDIEDQLKDMSDILEINRINIEKILNSAAKQEEATGKIQNNLNQKHQGVQAFLNKTGAFGAAFILIVTLLGLLVALNIVHITWFSSK